MHGDGVMTGGPSKWHMGAAGAHGWPAAATAGLPRVPQILLSRVTLRNYGGWDKAGPRRATRELQRRRDRTGRSVGCSWRLLLAFDTTFQSQLINLPPLEIGIALYFSGNIMQ
jgi:hypothetical protein